MIQQFEDNIDLVKMLGLADDPLDGRLFDDLVWIDAFLSFLMFVKAQYMAYGGYHKYSTYYPC